VIVVAVVVFLLILTLAFVVTPKAGFSCFLRRASLTRLPAIMASTSAKRPLSPTNAISPSKSARIRRRVKPKDQDVNTIDDDSDDDLELILAQIKESEESEKLAKQLQNDWASSSSPDIINFGDDAELARLIATGEWGNEIESGEWRETVDVDTWELQTNGSNTSNAKPVPSRSPSSEVDNVRPDQKLAEFRAFFTAERRCSKCGKPVKSPRGFVRRSPFYQQPKTKPHYNRSCFRLLLLRRARYHPH
jgi:hypothetical protein